MGRIFSGSDGQLWRNAETKLLRWDGKAQAWQETPVVSRPHPSWRARATPPWHNWQRHLRVIAGRDGCLLAVVTRDVYQDIPPEKLAGDIQWWGILQAGQELADKRGEPFWLEAWLYRDGKWSDAKPLADFLKKEGQFLTKQFVNPTPDPAFFELQVVGEILWWSDGTSVHALDKEGQEATWPLPEMKDYPKAALKNANLVLLGDGTLWCVVGLEVTALKLTGGKIEAKPEPQAALPKSHHHQEPQFHVARDGGLWMFRASTQGFDGRSLVFRKGQWTEPEGLGLFVLEDSDGAMWFLPGGGEGTHSGNGYNILKGDKRFRLPMPGDFLKGKLAPAGKDLLLAACGDRVIMLARSKEEPGWAIQSAFGLKRFVEAGPIWLDGQGSLVGESGWSAKLPETKPKE